MTDNKQKVLNLATAIIELTEQTDVGPVDVLEALISCIYFRVTELSIVKEDMDKEKYNEMLNKIEKMLNTNCIDLVHILNILKED